MRFLFTGPEFWLLRFGDLYSKLFDIAPLVANLRLNEGFSAFAGLGLVLNILAG